METCNLSELVWFFYLLTWLKLILWYYLGGKITFFSSCNIIIIVQCSLTHTHTALTFERIYLFRNATDCRTKLSVREIVYQMEEAHNV